MNQRFMLLLHLRVCEYRHFIIFRRFCVFFVDFSKLIQSRFSGRVTNLVRLDSKLVSKSILQRMRSILQCVPAEFWRQRSNFTLLECVSATNCQFETDTKSFENDTVLKSNHEIHTNNGGDIIVNDGIFHQTTTVCAPACPLLPKLNSPRNLSRRHPQGGIFFPAGMRWFRISDFP